MKNFPSTSLILITTSGFAVLIMVAKASHRKYSLYLLEKVHRFRYLNVGLV